MEILIKGEIKKLEKSFGTISSETMEDLLFYYSEVCYKNPAEGDLVKFKLEKNKRGSFEAVEINLVQKSKLKKPPKRKFQFFDKNDFNLSYELITEKLNYQLIKKDSFEDSEYIEEEINYLKNILDDLLMGDVPNIKTIDISHLNDFQAGNSNRDNINYWLNNFNIQEFGVRITEIGKIEPIKHIPKDYSIVWGEWRDKTKQIFKSGYDEKFFHLSYIDKGESEQTTVYDSPPPKTTWKLRKIIQKNTIFYISSAPVREIAQTSYVPSLPPIMKVTDTASRILNNSYKPNEWQREVEVSRVRKIEQFIEESSNIVANTPMLFINSTNSAKIINNDLVIDFSSFLKKMDRGEFQNKYVDRMEKEERDEAGNKIYYEYRPLWLIDGQHRIKGIHRSVEKEIEIPIIIFPNDFGANETAKVFAEINTLQKKLNPLHELFMQHRFNIDSVNTNRKFRNYREIDLRSAERENWGNDWLHSRANILSYEIAAKLAKDGVLKNQIQFLPQNEKNSTLVNADQWVNYSRDLFYSKCYKYQGDRIKGVWISNPSKKEEKMTEFDIFYEEFNNYFKAWIEICNHKDWDENKPNSWSKEITNNRKSLIQMRTPFIILLEIYSLVRDKAQENLDNNYEKKIIQKDDFYKALSVFKWVDWTDSNLKTLYSGSGESPRRSLEAWMSDAILNGVNHKYEMIHCENPETNMSKPGMGICSYLERPDIELISKNNWPTKTKKVLFRSKRPYNARIESTWEVFDKDFNTILEKKISCQKHILDSYVEFELKYSREFENLKEFKLQVEWKNAHSRTGKSLLEIKRD